MIESKTSGLPFRIGYQSKNEVISVFLVIPIKKEMSTDANRITNLVTACCVIKPLCSWNLERVASITRERCGGAGYLSCSRFGTFIGLAHAAMTAEGKIGSSQNQNFYVDFR